MRKNFTVLFQAATLTIALVFGAAGGALAQSCPAQMPTGDINRAIDARNADLVLFGQLVLYHTNAERCRRGLRPVQMSPGTQGAATLLSRDMAGTRTYSHIVPVPGLRNLADRMHFEGEVFERGGENIALNFFYALNGRQFSGSGCNFRYQGSGDTVPKHSYASLAAETFAGWMESSGHRSNILNRRYSRMGAAFGLDRAGQLCGQVYVAQVFAG